MSLMTPEYVRSHFERVEWTDRKERTANDYDHQEVRILTDPEEHRKRCGELADMNELELLELREWEQIPK